MFEEDSVALDRRTSPVFDGFTWYEDIPDSFICDCGKTTIDLTTLRRNFFAMLMLQVSGPRVEEGGKRQIIYDPLYRASNLEGLNAEYNRLLNTDPPEEKLQQFIECNPILLRQFPASRILFKPPVLTFCKADFAILSPQRELILIEIETTKTRLLKSNGGQAADLTHAVDQVRDWLITISEHRLACLASLKIDPDLVGPVRGVVIAGRDRGYNPDHLRRLKTTLSGQISLLTYDDLSASLGTLARELRSV